VTHPSNFRMLVKDVEGLSIGGGFYTKANTAFSEEGCELDGDFIPAMPNSDL